MNVDWNSSDVISLRSRVWYGRVKGLCNKPTLISSLEEIFHEKRSIKYVNDGWRLSLMLSVWVVECDTVVWDRVKGLSKQTHPHIFLLTVTHCFITVCFKLFFVKTFMFYRCAWNILTAVLSLVTVHSRNISYKRYCELI